MRTRTLLALIPLFAALAAGCNDGSAVLMGRLDPAALTAAPGADADKARVAEALPRHLRIRINGRWRDVAVGPDLSFAINELPTGDLTFSVEVGGIQGTLTLPDVQPHEIIEISISGSSGRLTIHVVRRERLGHHDGYRVAPGDGPISISGHHQVVYFDPGVYTGPVQVSGHHLVLVGASDACDPELRSVLAGDLLVSGHHIRVVNLVVEGRTRVSGHHVRVYGTCGGEGWDDWADWDDDDHDDD